jgi:hypothetical protein
MHTRAATIALAASLLFASFAHAQLQEIATGETKWSGHLTPGASVQIKGGLGNIDVVKSDGDTFSVEVKQGTEGAVVPRVAVLQTEKGAVVCADWTTPAGQPSQCKEGRGMLASDSLKNYRRADLRVLVPAGTNVDVRANEGNIIVEPLQSSVNAQTYVGGVSITADGPKVSAGNQRGGTVEVVMTPEPMKSKVTVDTIAGRIRLVIPGSRLVHYELYTHGAKVRSFYTLQRDGQNYNGSIGPDKEKRWTGLEVYVTDASTGTLEIDGA